MKQKSRFALGPGAASLILIVVVLSMSVLGILALMNARQDARLSDRSVQVIRAVYSLNAEAERALAELDEALLNARASAEGDEDVAMDVLRQSLPAGMLLTGNTVSWEQTDEARTLECAVEIAPPGREQRLKWIKHRLTATTEDAYEYF